MTSSGSTYISVFALTSCLLTATVRASAEWNYDASSPNGPENWHNSYPTCGDTSQSPINIETKTEAVKQASLTSGLTLQGYNTPSADTYTLSNNGHSAVITVKPKTNYIEGGGLPGGRYYLEQLHFHWGATESQGSEHEVDSKSYPLEVHLVHFHENYGNVSHAASSTSNTALAVLGVFVDVNDDVSKESKSFEKFIDDLSNVSYGGNTTSCESFELNTLLPSSTSMFYRYNGSLTTPGCAEVVVWTVFSDPIYITKSHLEEFRKLYSSDGHQLEHNYRPVQPLNSRIVYHYMNAGSQNHQSLLAVFFSVVVFLKLYHS